MTETNLHTDISHKKLLALISLQTQIAQLGLDLYGVMNLVTQRVLMLINADGAAIELSDGHDHLVYRATSGTLSTMLGFQIKRQGSLSGLSLQQHQALVCHDSETDPRVDKNACRAAGIRSMLVLPLDHQHMAVGVLKVSSQTANSFNDVDIAILSLISKIISAAMFYATKYGEDRLFQQATTDPLTHLANRSLFYDRLNNCTFIAQQNKSTFAVFMMDMDGLKGINDTMGHAAGDAAITEIAHRFCQVIHQNDTVARLGGDEFTALISMVSDATAAEALVQKMLSVVEQPFTFDGQPIKLSASIGFAIYPQDATDTKGLCDLADSRMYRIKRQRKHH